MNLAAVPLAQELFTGNGRIYQCGIYYPRRHRMHWRCAFSRAVWKCKHGNAESIRECGSMLAHVLDGALPHRTAYLITYVPSEADQEIPARHSRSAAHALAQTVFEELRDQRSLSIEGLIASVRRKEKKQHLCTSHQQRRENVIGCFAATKRRLIDGKNVIVIDDVATSGATILECHKVLLEAGAADVIGFVLARTVGWNDGRSS